MCKKANDVGCVEWLLSTVPIILRLTHQIWAEHMYRAKVATHVNGSGLFFLYTVILSYGFHHDIISDWYQSVSDMNGRNLSTENTVIVNSTTFYTKWSQ